MSENTKIKLIIIVGATASGKTSLAIELAKQFSGEVISADSRQVYRGLDVGTAKVTQTEMQGIPHHLIDVAELSMVYTVADFKRDATSTIRDICTRNHVPIIAGGTFFYIDVLLGQINVPAVAPNPKLRTELDAHTTENLFQQLLSKDPARANAIDAANRRRLIRALEVAHSLGTNPTPKLDSDSPYEVLWLGIERAREDLRSRYRTRAMQWLDGSFQAEVEKLLHQGIPRERLQEIGFEYRLMLDYLDQKLSDEEFITRAIEKNWQYAKRQLTWLKKNTDILWFKPDQQVEITSQVREFLNE